MLDQATLAVPVEDGGLLGSHMLVLSGRLLFGPKPEWHRRDKARKTIDFSVGFIISRYSLCGSWSVFV